MNDDDQFAAADDLMDWAFEHADELAAADRAAMQTEGA